MEEPGGNRFLVVDEKTKSMEGGIKYIHLHGLGRHMDYQRHGPDFSTSGYKIIGEVLQ